MEWGHLQVALGREARVVGSSGEERFFFMRSGEDVEREHGWLQKAKVAGGLAGSVGTPVWTPGRGTTRI